MLKRAIDLAAGICGLILLSPLFLAVSIAIKTTSRGPVFFRQVRVGRFGREFLIHKFRTMTSGADRDGPAITRDQDPRITRVGVFLRRHKIDELPQLLDVVSGAMSLVGPRPEVPKYLAYYTKEQQQVLLSVRPGLTDPASIYFRDEAAMISASHDLEDTYVRQILPRKLELSAAYVRTRSNRRDLGIIGRTLFHLIIPNRDGP